MVSNIKMSKATESSPKSLQVVFLVDITGSMGSQIEGVKQMIAKFCEIDRPLVDIHIWTFTESPGCHVTKSPEGLKSEGLVKYTRDIVLCRPPGKPEINAGGGDGPENVTAGIASLVDSFDINQNLLCFIITDAPPHCKAFGEGTETKEERKWLEDAGFDDTDIFIVLCQVIDSLNITFVPVLYGDSIRNVWFHQAAVMTEGLVLCPKQTSSETLALGLGTLLDTFQRLSVSRDLTLLRTLNTDDLSGGFGILDIDPNEFQMIEEDPNNTQKIYHDYKQIGSEELAEKLAAPFKTALDRFAGKKAATRCRGVSADHIAASIKVLIRGFQLILGSGDYEQLQSDVKALEAILEPLVAKSLNIEWDVKKLENFKKHIEASRSAHKVRSFVHDDTLPVNPRVLIEKLATKIEELNPKPYSELDVSNWLDVVLQLILVRLVNVKFAVDATGHEDFSDAWSAVLTKIDFKTIQTAASALTCRVEGEVLFTSPASGDKLNSAIIFAPCGSELLSEFYLMLSFFPTLTGLIQSHLISGGFKVFPSICIGLQSAAIWHLLRIRHHGPEFEQDEWDFVRDIAHSFEVSDLKAGIQIYEAAQRGAAFNPVDNFTKIYAGVLTFFRKNRPEEDRNRLVQRLLFEEYSADVVMFELKKAEAERNLVSEKNLVDLIIEPSSVKDFDPLSGQHYIEEITKKEKRLDDNFIDLIKSRLTGNKVITQTLNVFRTSASLFFCDLKNPNASSSLSEAKVKELTSVLANEFLIEVFIESLLLKRRSARYKLNEETKEWSRNSLENVDLSTLHDHFVELIKESYRDTMNNWNLKRKEAGLVHLSKIILEHQASSFEEFNTFLGSVEFTIPGYSFKISRIDVLDILNKIDENDHQKLSTLGLALIIGDWTNAPPGNLSKSLSHILGKFKFSEDIGINIRNHIHKTVECTRVPTAPNRHGHHKELKFPGITSWSQEYEDLIKSSKKYKKIKLGKRLKELKDYTTYYQTVVNDVLKSSDYHVNQRDIIEWCLTGHNDAGALTKVKNFVDRIKVAKIHGDEWAFKTKDLIKKLCSSKHPWKHLERYLKVAEKVES